MTLNNVMMARTQDFAWMSHKGTHILTGSLSEETLHEKFPYLELFWSVFSALGLITERYSYLSVFSLNVGKYRPEKLWIRLLFTHWKSSEVFKYSEITTNKLLLVLLFWTTEQECDAGHFYWRLWKWSVFSVYCTIKKMIVKGQV